MTIALCSTTCSGFEYYYFAIALGRDCYCSQTAPTGTPGGECTYPNSGSTILNPEIGGSDTAVSAFLAIQGAITPTGPGGTTAPLAVGDVLGGTYIGCLSTGTLSGAGTQDALQTQETCQITCAAYKYFAIGNGDTCYCDNSVAPAAILPFPDGTAQLDPETSCTVRAAGLATENGGGPDAVTAFLNPNYLGEYTRYGCASAQT